MIERIEPAGFYIPDTSVAGETRADGAWPAMADALQLSADRWLVPFSTRGFLGSDQGYRGSDNDRSILYQIRRDSAIGPVIREGSFARFGEEANPFGDAVSCMRQHCHTGAFGVPRGALVNGRRAPHENVFVATWYRLLWAKGTGPEDMPPPEYYHRLLDATLRIEWVQFRLNEAGDDIEIVQSPRPLRQKGYETGERFCSVEPISRMNKWYVKPVPYNADQSQWVQVPHFAQGLAAIRFAFNAATGLYEWVETGPLLAATENANTGDAAGSTGIQLTETSVVRYRDSWLVSARSAERLSKTVRGVAWLRTDDLFGKRLPPPIFPGNPMSKSPCSAFACPDGVVRLFTNDASASPYGNDRDPLFAWDIDPDDGFKASNRTVVFDAVAQGLPAREQSWMRVDMPNLLPHAGGREQFLTCRVRLRDRKAPHIRLIDEERRRTGAYHVRIGYDRECPPAWEFEPAEAAVS